MNIHPILVHFPIALLTVYSFMEIARFRFLRDLSYLFYIKASFVILGAGGAAMAYLTGDSAEHLLRVRGDQTLNHLVGVHSNWATVTLVIFGILALVYLHVWIRRMKWFGRFESKHQLNNIRLYVWKKKSIDWLISSPILILFAIIGLACVTITGALGGAIVYGLDSDPLIKLIYNLVIK